MNKNVQGQVSQLSTFNLINRRSLKLLQLIQRNQIQNEFNQITQRRKTLTEWFFLNSEERDIQIYTGKIDLVDVDDVLTKKQDDEILYRSFDFFKDTQWPFRIEKKFSQRVAQMTEQGIMELLSYMHLILDGHFEQPLDNLKVVNQEAQDIQPYQNFFRCDVSVGKNQTIIFTSQLEKVPKLSHGRLVGFDFVHCLRFVDLCNATDRKSIQQTIQKYQALMLKDPSRSDLGLLGQKQGLKKKTINKYLFDIEESQLSNIIEYTICSFHARRSQQDLFTRWFSQKFQTRFLNSNDCSQIKLNLDINRWVPIDYQSQMEREQLQMYQAQINRELLNRYADFTSAAKLVDLLQKIPNFKVRLTEQEKDVVGCPGNLLVIGRSGTGKTTCAVLRLFAMELLFKLRISLYKQKHQAVLQDTRFNADDIDQQVGLHCIFVTTSPVLTAEVQRYYNRLTDQVKAELDKKKERQRKQQEEQNKNTKQQNDDNDSDHSSVEFMDQEEKNLSFKQKQEEDFMQQEMGDIVIEAGELDDEAEEDQEEGDIIRQKMERFVSLAELQDKEFPAFLTTHKLILMIDAAMQRPFFTRSHDMKVVGSDTRANWSNENQGVLMIEDYRRKVNFNEDNEDALEQDDQIFQNEETEEIDFEDDEELEIEYQRQLDLHQMKKMKTLQTKSKKSSVKQSLAREVDFDYFLTNFWPRQSTDSVINPTLVWTEIYSYIKGSAQSHDFPGLYLSKRVYMGQDSRMLSDRQRELVYDIYIKYERWKINSNFYDLMDVVNYLLVQFKYGRYNGAPIHYLMVDEVQDLTHATLLLLSKITEQGLFFAGDTAQNIAKGVGFRFCDLRSLFQKRHFGEAPVDPPTLKQLTVNFRSHNQILEVANSLVSLLELFFPKTIDRLLKERSDIKGPKPTVLEGSDPDILFFILSGQEKYMSTINQPIRQPLEFGCNQVVIVRDAQSKTKVPSMLQHALCLTIYEAKGLEFDDVILFNFFADSEITDQQWSLLNQTKIIDQWVGRDEFYRNVTRHNKDVPSAKVIEKTYDDTSSGSESQSDQEEDVKPEVVVAVDDNSANLFGFEEKDGQVLTRKLVLKPTFSSVNIIEFSALCNELKQLYVAVTRPRNRLIIFDDQSTSRRDRLVNMWVSLNLIDHVTEDQMKRVVEQRTNLEFQEVASQTSRDEWRRQGLKMFRNRFYEQAVKCFIHCNDSILEDRSTAYFLADKASKQQAELDALKTELQSRGMVGIERRAQVKRSRDLRSSTRAIFVRAAELFQKDGKLKLSAQCLYSAENYNGALVLYEQLGLWKQAGEAAYLTKQWGQSAHHFDRAGDYIRAIDSYERMRDWDSILVLLHKYKGIMNIQTREAYLKRFLPSALSQLMQQVDMNPQQEDEIKQQQPINQLQQMIQEDQEEDEDQDDDQDDQDDDQDDDQEDDQEDDNCQEDQKQESIIIQQPLLELAKQPSSSFEETQGQQQQDQVISFSESEDPVQQMISFAESSQEISLASIQHLTHLDLEDEFLQNDRISIMQSIQSARVSEVSQLSEFSAVSYADVVQNPQMQLVRTRGDIYIQDNVMQKIIRYISMFSDEFKYSLLHQRSKIMQLTQNEKQSNDFDYIVDFILDLDLVDIEFIYLVLDTLEQFRQYKLCIFVCNRYKLASKVGRYLASIATKYSPLALQPATLVQSLITDHSQMRQQKLEQSLVAKTALHSVLENINPDYLRMQFQQGGGPSLGLCSFQQLALLGYWKQCLYSLDWQNALSLAENMGEYGNWRFLELSARLVDLRVSLQGCQDWDMKEALNEKVESCSEKLKYCFIPQRSFDVWPFVVPQSERDCKFAQVSLDEFLQNQLTTNQQTINQMVIKLPSVFQRTQAFLTCLNKPEQLDTLFTQIILESRALIRVQELKPSQSLNFYEGIRICLMAFEIQQIKNLSDVVLLDLLTLMKDFLREFRLQQLYQYIILSVSHLNEQIIEACMVASKVRQVKAKIFEPISGCQVIVNRNSPLIHDILNHKQQQQPKQEEAQLNSQFFFIDIDFDNIIGPMPIVLNIIQRRITQSINGVIRSRVNQLIMNPQISSIEYALALVDIRKQIGGFKETIKPKNIDTKLSRTDPLRQFQEFEKQQKHLRLMEKILKDDDEDVEEDYAHYDRCAENQLNPSKYSPSKENEVRKFILQRLNQHLMQNQGRAGAQQLHTQIVESLMGVGLYYLSKARKLGSLYQAQHHKYIIRGSLIMNYIGKQQHSLSLIRSLSRGSKSCSATWVSYRKFIEYLEVKNLRITPDQIDLLFEYVSVRAGNLYADELVSYFQCTVIQVLMAMRPMNRRKQLFLVPDSLVQQFQGLNAVVPLEDDGALVETVYWVRHFLGNVQLMSPYVGDLFQLIQTLIVNVECASSQLIDEIRSLISKMMNSYDKIGTRLQKNGIFTKLMQCSYRDFNQDKKNIVGKDGCFIIQFNNDQALQQISILNNIGKVDEVYDKSLQDWNNLDIITSGYIMKIKPIIRLISKSVQKLNKLSNFKDMRVPYTIFKDQNPQYIPIILLKLSLNKQLPDLINQIHVFRRVVLQCLYQSYLDNALDFHYISLVLNHILEKETVFIKNIREFLDQSLSQKEIYKIFCELKKEFETIQSSFESWKSINIKYDCSVNKLLEKNRKILALKWMQKNSGISTQLMKIQKKRTGLKKQQALQQKRLKIK